MLNSLRQAAGSWVSKVLLLLLVVSFGIWGVSGQFFDYGAATVARVGDEEITIPEFDRALQQQMQMLSSQTGGQFTMDQARTFGLPQQVLGQLMAEAALDDQARRYNLGVSDERLAQEIAKDPTFHGVSGSFDRARFQALLRNAGLREDDYIRQIRHGIVRDQLAGAVSEGITAPQPLVEAIDRYQNEERTVSFLTIDQSAVEAVGEPDQAALQTYFDAHKDEFRAPEYRKLGILAIDPKSVADPSSVTDEEIAAEYRRREETDFTKPERRRVEQIRFDTREAAEQGLAAIQGGTDFGAYAQSRGMSASDIDLGMKTKAEIVDQAVADAAFAAEPNAVVPVLDGRLGPAVVRVTEVEPGKVTPLEEAAPQIREQLAERRAREHLVDLYNQVEDQLAGGATLQEIAQSLSLPYRTIDGVAQDGATPNGTNVTDIPGQQQVLEGAFDSDVGVENDAVRLADNGYVFYDVLEIVPERERMLDEVRTQVVDAWRREELANRITAKAEELFKRLQAGETIQAIATELGKQPQVVEKVKRGTPAQGLSQNAIAQAFAGPQGHVANAEADNPLNRILLRVDNVVVPAYFAESPQAQQIAQQLHRAIQGDVLRSYNAQVLQSTSTRVNNAAYTQVVGEQALN